MSVDTANGRQVLSESAGVRVWCPGRARTKGSLKPTHLRLGGGRCRVGLREDGEHSVPWKNAMITAVRRVCDVQRYAGPVEVHAFFRFEREGADGTWPVGRQYGDEDKLRRNLLDALTQSGLLADDSQVIGGQTWKRFVRPIPDGVETPGVEFVVLPARGLASLGLLERVALSLRLAEGLVQG